MMTADTPEQQRSNLQKRFDKKQKLYVDQESFKKILEVVGMRVQSIEYLYDSIEGRMDDEVVQEIVKLLDFAKFLSTSSGNPWVPGEPIELMSEANNFDFLQLHLTNQAASQIQVTDITLDCAISDYSKFIRGYSSGGKPLDTQTVDSLDKLFNGWLATMKFKDNNGRIYNLISKDGAIYKATKAEIWQDDQGNLIKVEPDDFRSALDLKEDGLEAFVRKRNKHINSVDVIQHEFPEEQAAPQ